MNNDLQAVQELVAAPGLITAAVITGVEKPKKYHETQKNLKQLYEYKMQQLKAVSL